jgi:hypothetical protein
MHESLGTMGVFWDPRRWLDNVDVGGFLHRRLRLRRTCVAFGIARKRTQRSRMSQYVTPGLRLTEET